MQPIALIILINSGFCANYFFVPNNDMKSPESWLANRVPCEDDRIRFASEKAIVTMLNGTIQASEIELPRNGIIFFGDSSVIGEKGAWQCPRRTLATHAYFKAQEARSFFNGSNWSANLNDTGDDRLLHSSQIPSNQDMAIFRIEGANKVFIDDYVSLAALQYSGQPLLNSQMQTMLFTLESQYQFILADKLKTVTMVDGIEFPFPNNNNVISILGSTWNSNLAGTFNNNAESKTMKTICKYQHCKDTCGICRNPINPVGHCCKVCGSMLTFRGMGVDFKLLQDRIRQFKQSSSFALQFQLHFSLLRIDHNDTVPLYQITVLGRESNKFDERVYYEVLQQIIQLVRQYFEFTNGLSIYDLRETYSSNLDTGRFTMLIIAISSVLLLIIGFIFVSKRHFPQSRVSRFFTESTTGILLSVRWRSNKLEEDQVELIHAQYEGDIASHEEYSEQLKAADKEEETGFSTLFTAEAASPDKTDLELSDSEL